MIFYFSTWLVVLSLFFSCKYDFSVFFEEQFFYNLNEVLLIFQTLNNDKEALNLDQRVNSIFYQSFVQIIPSAIKSLHLAEYKGKND